MSYTREKLDFHGKKPPSEGEKSELSEVKSSVQQVKEAGDEFIHILSEAAPESRTVTTVVDGVLCRRAGS